MLKEITLGQYFPGDSLIHRLDPRTKLMVVVLFIIALFLSKSFVSYGLMVLFLAYCVAVSKVGLKALFKGMKPIIFILIFTGVLNLFYSSEGTMLFQWKFLHITTGGLHSAFFMVLRVMLLISGTSPIRLTDGLESLLGPLKKLKVPVHELAMMMSIALRFIPTLIEETDKIISAQKARGANFDDGNLFQRAKAMVPLLVPLFVSSFRRADELATAMECRCYHGGQGRTKLHQLHYHRRDAIAMLCCILLFSGVVVAARGFGL